ncbi:GAF domain-containing protein [Thermodesulfobacteriota bacterium]
MKKREENKTTSLKRSSSKQEKRPVISKNNIGNSITSADDIFDERHRTILDFVPYPMAVLSLDDKINYLNPAFTRTFGWTFNELRGKPLPYIPLNLQDEAKNNKKILLKEKLHRLETKRFTKDGRLLDVIIRGAIYTNEDKEKSDGQIIITRNITQEKKLVLTNETLLRISTALPEYPVLEELLDYISSETKRLLNSESATVAILDETRNEIFFLGAAYDDSDAKYRVKKVRFPVENSITGRVIKTGKPVIVHDASKEPDYYPGVDEQADIKTNNMLFVPLRSYDRTIGVLAAMNKKEGSFDDTDLELMNMIAGTVALSVENARYSEELREAYHEVTSLNRAKDKVINHLSHELKTPASVLLASLNILAKRLELLPQETWLNTLNRAKRNIERILAIQYEVEDIMQNRDYSAYHMLSHLLEECRDELEVMAAEELGEGEITRRIRNKVDDIFGPKISKSKDIELVTFFNNKLDHFKHHYDKRHIEIARNFEDSIPAYIPEDVLDKVLTGLVRNAIENTPDNGRIELSIRPRSGGTELIVEDFGVGITEESQRRIFEGFFTTQETMDYSSKRPFQFNAGGKGADLLRIKIFAERYNFKVNMQSARCKYIPGEIDICPGNIRTCSHCEKEDDCYQSGGTRFTLFFPGASED